ncbi:HAD-IA family hydrolase [Georgenia halophila]|uniref:HAD-IA family hydrolase n=1 Tax=Georgenia halophila TaxID=620889 RepID=A0ABP8L9U2_9MICO
MLDLGQVLVGWDPYLAVADRVSRTEWEAFSVAVDFPALNHSVDAGTTATDAAARAAAVDPAHGETVTRYYENFAGALTGPVPGTTEIVEELAAAGVRLLGLTNWSAETFHHAAVAAPVIDLLEEVVVSGREGLVKPDPAIFRIVVDRLGVDPARAVFVDDSEPNVCGAASVGFTALHFTGADRLRGDLQRLGLLRAA